MFDFPIILPLFDPNFITIGGFGLKWYSLAYVFGILAVMASLKIFNKKYQFLPQKAYDDWLFWAVIGVILGGRIGYVMFYNGQYYLDNFWQIFAIWRGGMSFHGGLIGGVLAMFLFAKKYQVDFLRLMDVIAIGAPVGLFLGRIANFINMELYGRPTGVDYGVVWPLIDDLPRHPSQLYEAFLEGFLAFVVLLILVNFTRIFEKKGALAGLFLVIYGIARIFVEKYRQPDLHIGFVIGDFTMGQILSLPIVIFGLVVFFTTIFKKNVEK